MLVQNATYFVSSLCFRELARGIFFQSFPFYFEEVIRKILIRIRIN